MRACIVDKQQHKPPRVRAAALPQIALPYAQTDQIRAEREEKEKRAAEEVERERLRQINSVLQQKAPEVGAGIAATVAPTVDRQKVALMMDKQLEQKLKETVSHNAQINSKVMDMVGDANKLAPAPASKRLGSIMSPEAKVRC